jgi:hypothetical protein
MRGEDAKGYSLSIPGGEREDALSHAWWRKWIRCTWRK